MENKQLPRVLAAHALAGFGKCSLTVAIPVLSACGVEVCPLPTVIMSTNTGFPGMQKTDFTDHMEGHLNHYSQIGLDFDGLYSGFLGSVGQIEIVMKAKALFHPALTIIDPVMGDNGVRYSTFTPAMCSKVRELCSIADIITPNLTEACILTDTPYENAADTKENIRQLCDRLKSLGTRNVVLTGIERPNSLITAVLDEQGDFNLVEQPKLPYHMFGTGDTFASILCGKMLKGHSLYSAVRMGTSFVAQAMELSYGIPGYEQRGVCFEPLLHKLY